MNSSWTITTAPPSHFRSLSSSSSKTPITECNNYETRHSPTLRFNAERDNTKKKKMKLPCLKVVQNHGFGPTDSPPSYGNRKPAEAIENGAGGLVVAEKIRILVSEFKSLEEPVERVRRLLEYAAKMPACGQAARVEENRVAGCATQVWVEAEMDEVGRMRFRADSDSEISKGFCSCLMWMLDGAEPQEVLEVKTEDLEHVNVGLYVKAKSRVNTWHNVLICMQKRTLALVNLQRDHAKTPPLMDPLLPVSHEIRTKNHGSSAESQGLLVAYKVGTATIADIG